MPMTWNAEAEAKLFSAVIQVADVKLSADNLKKIAEFMGEECTPKAITHRIQKYKSLAKGSSSAGEQGGGENVQKAKKAAPAFKAKGKGSKAAKKADTPVEEDDEETAAAVMETKPKKAASKRKKTETPEESAEDGKKIKLDEADEF